MQAVPLPDGRSFMRLHYSYAMGTAAKLATKGYLATSGSGKVGFTREGDRYVRGLRGAVERNAMRYYLAVESYLARWRRPGPAVRQPHRALVRRHRALCAPAARDRTARPTWP
jgi:hypothetical protein